MPFRWQPFCFSRGKLDFSPALESLASHGLSAPALFLRPATAHRSRLVLVVPWLQPGSLSLVARACPACPAFSKGILHAIFTRHTPATRGSSRPCAAAAGYR